ncbi:MAG: hypothetical protein WCS96_11390 [Victivallales bacterium]
MKKIIMAAEGLLQTRASLEGMPGEPWEINYGRFSETSSGLVATEESCLFLSFPSPGYADFQVTLDITSESGAGVLAELSGYSFIAGKSSSPGFGDVRGTAARISMNDWPVCVTGHTGLEPGQRCELIYSRCAGRVQMVIDGARILDAEDPRPEGRVIDLALYLPGRLTLHKVIVRSSPPAQSVYRPQKVERYDLYSCIDFYDDLIKNPWTERTYRETMETYRRNRIKRVYFIDHFGYKSGFWDERPQNRHYPSLVKNVHTTYCNAGDFLPAAVKAAHAAGLPLFAVLKPNDTAFYATLPEGSDDARRYGKIPRLGGPQFWSNHFTAEHPDFRTERDMSGVPADISMRVIGSIRLYAEACLDGKIDKSRLRLWVSPDNSSYQPYAGPLEMHATGGNVTLDRLLINEKFFAVTVSDEPTYRFGNRLRDLIEAYDDCGKRLPITYGYMDRSAINHDGNGDWHVNGFAMDVPGNAFGAMDDYFWLDGIRPLACGLGLVRHLPGALEAAYPEVQSWWLRQVDACIAAGVDGIDFRIGSHNRTFDWAAYGFNKPVVDAFKARYGVDILHEPFDRQAWRELRGEFYTGFLREASARLRGAGKGVQAHVRADMQPPNWHTWKEINYDWRCWMKDGLMDELTVMSQELRTAPAAGMAETARKAGIKVNYRPVINSLARMSSGPQRLSHLIREACEGGADGFIIYENESLMTAAEDGSAKTTCPWIFDMLREKARK